MKNESLVFGWVSANINSNWAAWSSWKDYGDADDASRFYEETAEDAEEQGLTWFCYDDDSNVENEEQ